MIRSLRHRVLAAVLVVAAFAAVASAVLVWTYVTNTRSAAERARAAEDQAVQQVAYRYLLPVGSASTDWTGLTQAVDAAAAAVSARVVVLDRASGAVLADSNPAGTPATEDDTDAILNPAYSMVAIVAEGGIVRGEGAFGCGEDCFDAVDVSSPPVDLVVMDRDPEARAASGETGSRFDALGTAAAVVGIVLTSGLAAAFVAKRVTRPVVALGASVTKFGRGDFGERFADGGAAGEIADLGAAFNEMASNLQNSEAARTAMIADVAHELRNPISTIIGNIEAAQDRVLPLDGQLLDRLHHEATHLADLMDDLRQFALADAGELEIDPEVVDLGQLIADTVGAYEHLAEQQGITLTTTLSRPLAATVDATRIRQVIGNLVKNALIHTPASGTVEVAASAVDGAARIEVSDTGIGLSVEDQARVFDRFWRADPSRSRASGGTGVGLAICQTLVEAHRGSITVTSELGNGSRFIVTLPPLTT